MSMEAAERIVKALLFEGHVLYPYRASSLKNQQRWPFSTLHPKAFCLAQDAADPHATRTGISDWLGRTPPSPFRCGTSSSSPAAWIFHEAVERRGPTWAPSSFCGLVERAQSLTVPSTGVTHRRRLRREDSGGVARHS